MSATTSPIRSCRSIEIRSRARTRGTCTRRARARAAPPAAVAAVAAAIEAIVKRSLLAALCLLVVVRAAQAGVLPEDRADVLVHSYDGGGVTIQGPSLLVRKQFAQKFSVLAVYFIEKVQSASIDVITTASPYTEERKQWSVGLDYLHDRWMLNVGVIDSEEPDYSSKTFSFGVSQDLFGDLTTVSLGY